MRATDRFIARKKSMLSLRRKRSGTDSVTTVSATLSDQKSSETRSTPPTTAPYTSLLETPNSFRGESNLGITDDNKNPCKRLLEEEQTIPSDSLFRDDLFASTCRAIEESNEFRLIRDISPLLVPSAENLTIYGTTQVETLIESVNECWDNSDPLTNPCPQPHYSVGFRRSAFTNGQLDKLSLYIGDLSAGGRSLFLATFKMYFPFLRCEN